MLLVPEPENKFDSDAIKCLVRNKRGEEFCLGYIPNRETICEACSSVLDRHPGSTACPTCNRLGTLQRYGLATRLAGVSIKNAYITEVTGGGDKSYGCNLRLEVEDE